MSERVEVLEKPSLRVVSAPPIQAVEQVNALLSDYSVMNFHWAVVKDELILSALLVNKSEIRKMALASAQMPGMRQ